MNCKRCSRALHPDEIALCMKMLGRETEEFICLDCLSERMNVKKTGLEDMISRFKRQGCQLFSVESK
jgi:biotin operon repressor